MKCWFEYNLEMFLGQEFERSWAGKGLFGLSTTRGRRSYSVEAAQGCYDSDD